jgi:hypothetical protein
MSGWTILLLLPLLLMLLLILILILLLLLQRFGSTIQFEMLALLMTDPWVI